MKFWNYETMKLQNYEIIKIFKIIIEPKLLFNAIKEIISVSSFISLIW